MMLEDRAYRTLVVSSSRKFNDVLVPLLSAARCEPITFTDCIASAKRYALENKYDFLIVNSPLPDDPGFKLCTEMSLGKDTVCLLFVRTEQFSDMKSRVTPYGVFTLAKPTSSVAVANGLNFMAAAREKLRGLEKKTVTLEEKMEEIRMVNKAKWLLIDRLKMTEPDAHRYIEKQAMDTCTTKGAVAREIIRSYS